MKKLFCILIIAPLAGNSLHAQSIISFTVIPSNPTPSDTIMIITSCMFPSGGCDGMAQITNMSGNTINADAIHCLGPLAVICNDEDTVVISPLPADTYTFIFSLTIGHGFPCTPGIVIDDIDTLNFLVEDITGIEQISREPFRIFPNPSRGELRITKNSNEPLSVRVISSAGAIVRALKLNSLESEKEIELPKGVYFINIQSGQSVYNSKFVVY